MTGILRGKNVLVLLIVLWLSMEILICYLFFGHLRVPHTGVGSEEPLEAPREARSKSDR